MTKPKPKPQTQSYRPELCKIAQQMAEAGATDYEIAEGLGINRRTIYRKLRKYREEGHLPEGEIE